MIVFMVICTIFNIGLIIATSSKSGELKKMSENYEYQSGQKIFQDIDASELGSAYYDERYKKSNTLVAWMHEKYQKLESSLEMLSEQFYEGDPEYEKARKAEANGEGEEYEWIADVDSNYDEETAAEPIPHHYEHLVVEGNTYEGAYNDKMLFGMSVPKELWTTNDDLPAAYHEDVDQVNGATLTIEVTFLDDSTETHHYRLSTGKIFVPSDENGYLQWDNLTRFISSEDEPYTYGYLMEKID